MTVSLCIRQGSKRNDDSVSVEELDCSAESHVLINRVIATTVCVCGKKREYNRPLLFFWGAFYTRLPKSKEVNEWNRESNGRFKARGRRAQEMTHLVIGWMLVHSNLSNKSENAGGNIGGGSKKSGGQSYLFLKCGDVCGDLLAVLVNFLSIFFCYWNHLLFLY